MAEVFGSEYAGAYDLLYGDKDYAAECDLIEQLFHAYESPKVQSILDLGCGTGNHAIPLARRGYEVLGVDQSDEMLDLARKKACIEGTDKRARFENGDIRSLQINRSFDAAAMMFAVLGYQLENQDVLATLRTTRDHLKAGGLLVFDVWYGPAVLGQRPADRTKIIPTEKGQILRTASAMLDVQRHLCQVRYRLSRMESDRIVAEAEENHWMRYFFPQELNLFLQCTEFVPLRMGSFPHFEREPDETTWNVLTVARAV